MFFSSKQTSHSSLIDIVLYAIYVLRVISFNKINNTKLCSKYSTLIFNIQIKYTASAYIHQVIYLISQCVYHVLTCARGVCRFKLCSYFPYKNFGINKLLTAFNPMFPNFSALCVQLKMSLKFTDTYAISLLACGCTSQHKKTLIPIQAFHICIESTHI